MFGWLLVFAIVGKHEGIKQIKPISTFETRELCETAGRDMKTWFAFPDTDLIMYRCVARSGPVAQEDFANEDGP